MEGKCTVVRIQLSLGLSFNWRTNPGKGLGTSVCRHFCEHL